MTFFFLDGSREPLTPALTASFFSGRELKCCFWSFTPTLNQSHQQPLRIECEWRLPPEISCIPSRHHPAAETVTNWYLEDMLLQIISFTSKDYSRSNKTRAAICETRGLQIVDRSAPISNFVPFEIARG